MKKSNGKTLIVLGVITVLLLPVIAIFLIAVFLPDLAPEYGLAAFFGPNALGVLMIISGVAMQRAEEQGKKKKNIFSFFTPAQFALAAASVLFPFAMLTSVDEDSVLASILFLGSFCSFLLAVVLCILHGIRNSRETKRAFQRHGRDALVCERCGKRILASEMKKMDGRILCKPCAEAYLHAQWQTIAAPQTACCVCGVKQQKEKLILSNDAYYCADCFEKRSAAARADFGTKDGKPYKAEKDPSKKDNEQGTASPSLAAPAAASSNGAPAALTCIKCGKELQNDGPLLHLGKRYYCAACYMALKERLRKRKVQELAYALQAVLEQKRLLYHTVCARCGADHPKSDMHLIEGIYLCRACFDRQYAFEVPGKPQKKKQPTGAAAGFDDAAFRKNYGVYIVPRLPKDVEDPAVQKSLLETLWTVIPVADDAHLRAEEEILSAIRAGTVEHHAGICKIAQIAERMMACADFSAVDKLWPALSDAQLLDAFIVLDYYGFISAPEDAEHLLAARTRLALAIRERLPEKGDRSQG